VTRFVLIRHGQTEWNRIERFRGRADVPLNETGLRQAAATGKRIAADWKISAVYSSPLSRAVKTAEAIAEHFGLPVQTHPGLIDIDYGAWLGLSPEQARQRWPAEVAAWYSTPERARIRGGEGLDGLRERTVSAVRGFAGRHAGETIAMVGHIVVNRVILLAVLGLGLDRFWHLQQEPCAINVFESDGADFVLCSMNDTCHLRGLG